MTQHWSAMTILTGGQLGDLWPISKNRKIDFGACNDQRWSVLTILTSCLLGDLWPTLKKSINIDFGACNDTTLISNDNFDRRSTWWPLTYFLKIVQNWLEHNDTTLIGIDHLDQWSTGWPLTYYWNWNSGCAQNTCNNNDQNRHSDPRRVGFTYDVTHFVTTCSNYSVTERILRPTLNKNASSIRPVGL